MSPLTHLMGSWLIASAATDNPRDRKLVTLAGIIPDADGLGFLADVAVAVISGEASAFHYYQHYHHNLLHGWPAAIAVTALLAGFAHHRLRVVLLCVFVFHLHLLCDLIGSRGPSPTDLWPVSYGEPFLRHPVWFWRGQWQLDGWQNRTVFVVVFFAALWLSARRGYSFVGVFSRRLDAVFVSVLQKWQASFHKRKKAN